MIFNDLKELKDDVREYNIKLGKVVKFPKNESIRVRVVCTSDGCPWLLFASKMQNSSSMQIKTFVDEHKCARKFKNRYVTSRWLTKKIWSVLGPTPSSQSRVLE